MARERYELRTERGYDFYEVASALQKSIRRGQTNVAGYFAIELWESGYGEYCWKRLLTISAEDCFGIITTEIQSLYSAYKMVQVSGKQKGRVFISKAVILLSQAMKSRDADHLSNLVYDKHIGISEGEIERWIDESRAEAMAVPDYTFDIHTKRGRLMGKTKKDFFIEEQAALNPLQKGLFDNLLDSL